MPSILWLNRNTKASQPVLFRIPAHIPYVQAFIPMFSFMISTPAIFAPSVAAASSVRAAPTLFSTNHVYGVPNIVLMASIIMTGDKDGPIAVMQAERIAAFLASGVMPIALDSFTAARIKKTDCNTTIEIIMITHSHISQPFIIF